MQADRRHFSQLKYRVRRFEVRQDLETLSRDEGIFSHLFLGARKTAVAVLWHIVESEGDSTKGDKQPQPATEGTESQKI